MTTRNFPRSAGAYSRARISLPRATPGNNRRRRASVTFYANATWAAPIGVPILPRVTGKGSDGKPATGSHNYVDGYRVYTQAVTYVKAEDRFVYGSVVLNSTLEGSPVPSGFRNIDDEDANFIYYQDFTFSYTQIDNGNYVGPTTGAASTGFGQVFAGGPSGEPAPTTSFLNIPITAGASYPIVVPLGGYITIEY